MSELPFHAQDLIRAKRDGRELSPPELQAFVHAVVYGSMSDAQIAAFLMAAFLRGLSRAELAALTHAMRVSGETFDSKPLHTRTVDKHSTGGVGDKTSLLLAPIVAAAGLAEPTAEGVPGICVPMISGRSLGHTGGTLDKLETIPGFDTQLSLACMEQVLRACGAAMIGQTENLVPADRILYALRDHTATVESPNLITASIMSKKLAEGLDALVLDVKTGSGAFLQRMDDARLLARLMVETGEAAGTRTVALLTDHSEPLGRYAGNWLEVLECVDILQGRRHPASARLIELTLTLAGWMLHLARPEWAATPEAGAARAGELLQSGEAHAAWLKIVQAQGGDASIFGSPQWCHQPGASRVLRLDRAGYLSRIDTMAVGWAVQRLGAGRARPGEPVDAHAGIELHAKLGDRVEQHAPLVTLYAASEAMLDEPESMIREAITLSKERTAAGPQVLEVIPAETSQPGNGL